MYFFDFFILNLQYIYFILKQKINLECVSIYSGITNNKVWLRKYIFVVFFPQKNRKSYNKKIAAEL